MNYIQRYGNSKWEIVVSGRVVAIAWNKDIAKTIVETYRNEKVLPFDCQCAYCKILKETAE